MKPSTPIRRAALLAAVALATSACGLGDTIAEQAVEELAERAGGADNVDIDTEDGSITIESSEGDFSIGGGDLPDEFPDELPLPDGIGIRGSLSQDNEDGQTVGIQATFDGELDELVEFYERELEAAGWTVTETTNMDSAGLAGVLFQIEGFGYTGIVNAGRLGPADDEDAIVSLQVNLTVEPEA